MPPALLDRVSRLFMPVVAALEGERGVWVVGGAVRDLLLGREPKDWDVATDAPPARVRELFPRSQAVGAAFGVILVRHRKSQIEVATFRSDGRYVDGRRPEGQGRRQGEGDDCTLLSGPAHLGLLV